MSILKFIGLTILITLAIIAILALCVYFSPDAEAGQEPNWDKLVSIIIQIESSGNPIAISKAGCIGLMQINPIVLKEYIEILLPIVLKTNDLYYIRSITDLNEGMLYDPQVNVKIGTWYLKRIWFHYLPHYKLEQTIQNLLISYHDGPRNCYLYHQGKRKLGAEMKAYLKKYQKLANE